MEALSLSVRSVSLSLEEVSLLGHVVSKDGNAVHPERIEAIVEWERPPSVRLV